MDIKKENTLYRLFMWCLGICDKFTDKYLSSRYRNQTNLCHFVRVIIFYTPMILAFHLLVLGSVIGVLILPFFLFSLEAVGAGLLVLIMGVLGIFAVGFIISKLSNFPKTENETWKLVKEFAKAKKAKICPYIYFNNGD